MNSDFWAHNRLGTTLLYTLGIILVAALIYIAGKKQQKIATLLNGSITAKVLKIFRRLLAGAAIILFILSFFPIGIIEGIGLIFYIVYWPMLAGQFILGLLPWEKFFPEIRYVTIILAIIVGIGAFAFNTVLLQTLGYWYE